MSVAEKYSGFLDHVQTYLGPVGEVEPPEVAGRNRGFALFFCNSSDNGLVSVVTNGLRFQPVVAIKPQELVCTLNADQHPAAHLLTALTAEMVIRSGRGLTFGQVAPSPQPLIPDTDITGVLATTHPYLDDDDFEALRDKNGTVELQLITLIPMTGAEVTFAEQRGVDTLFQRWEEQETDLLDIRRPPAV